MNINQLIFRNIKKNLKNYYLYVFALIFIAALYFAFVTLQYDPSMDAAKGTVKGAASVRAASILLVAIVSIFLLYANTIFIKRRSKEIGLFQLIGMTKNKIFRILTLENLVLYFGSLWIGIFAGFSFSKLIIMILFKTTGVDAIASLRFSSQALVQTLIVFTVIYLLIMIMNYIFIKRQSILALFRVTSSTEGKIKKLSVFEIVIGVFGIGMILTGYYISSKLFTGDFTTMPELFGAMIFILASVILGTYLFYKGSVSFLLHLLRKRKDGYLSINEVMSLASVMFRMKSNALLLTIITTVSALAIALLSLTYISYYSAEKTAADHIPHHFSIIDRNSADKFETALKENNIEYTETSLEVIQASVNAGQLVDRSLEELVIDPKAMPLPLISDKSVDWVDVSPKEVVFTGYNDLLQKFMPLKDSGMIQIKGKTEVIPQTYQGLEQEHPVSWYFTGGGVPVAVVDDTVFKRVKKDLDPKIQKESTLYIGVNINNKEKLEKANDLFKSTGTYEKLYNESRLEISTNQKKNMGLMMFIVGFLGLTFLITSGCILYFKQMDEGESEKPNYTILRKLGYTQGDLLKGIQFKQLFNFGIPLAIGLLHGYFAVQSGWFLFGAEVWTPMIIVMVVYTVLYSIFGMLSVLYYKKVIKESL
ncbi:ABC transporter permease [Fictibacillus barbaricus]|uniref:ABC transporter permease n=1 Tax=Fictibacillus barbaricus TaxID=182136 RepID=A0ABS2ZDD1_9BACL|nr:ABC transporter permease [Fictibacillus barbaricus]MBN3546198.1 ABC transporter permease [Fictibacillus barbaricus]GGB39271.1 bacitracin export permease protein BceB [Fictibacillus barbaricus]